MRLSINMSSFSFKIQGLRFKDFTVFSLYNNYDLSKAYSKSNNCISPLHGLWWLWCQIDDISRTKRICLGMTELKRKDNFHYKQWEILQKEHHRSTEQKWSYSLKISLEVRRKLRTRGLKFCLFKTYIEAQKYVSISP